MAGNPTEKKKTTSVSIKIDEQLHTDFRVKLAERRETAQDVLESAIVRYLAES